MPPSSRDCLPHQASAASTAQELREALCRCDLLASSSHSPCMPLACMRSARRSCSSPSPCMPPACMRSSRRPTRFPTGTSPRGATGRRGGDQHGARPDRRPSDSPLPLSRGRAVPGSRCPGHVWLSASLLRFLIAGEQAARGGSDCTLGGAAGAAALGGDPQSDLSASLIM